MPKPPPKTDAPGDKLPAELRFSGRSVLYVHEVAKKLSITSRHVVDLIEEGKIKALNVAGDNNSDRKFYRIPVTEFEKYVQRIFPERMKATPQAKPAGLDFPGRTVLAVGEVAQKLGLSDQHVLDLIEEGKLGAVDVGSGSRRHFRIPVAEYEKFLGRRFNHPA